MFEKLKDLLNNSYSPYSNFKVAAIAVMNDGKEFSGVNVENASYGATICAERSALVNAISAGYKEGDVNELHILVNSKKISTCCFLCRQTMIELMVPEAIVICYNILGECKKFRIDDLCPYPFSENDLK